MSENTILVAGQVRESNVRRLLVALNWIADGEFDLDRWADIRRDFWKTDHTADRWHEFELAGRRPIRMRLAGSREGIYVEVYALPDTVSRVELLIRVFTRFRVGPPPGYTSPRVIARHLASAAARKVDPPRGSEPPAP